jgi:hypothetical protein
MTMQPSLYDRLGGVYSIATVVDDLIDRVMANPRLNANPLVDEAHHAVLSRRRAAEIHWQGHEEFTPGLAHQAGRVGRVHG